ncbi:hypothetical protein BB559_003560 [Furculomyces boomerangus]|uniref:Tyrosine specific protein phosphatases domain-containing protein n=2 Tax=Harpellales TaxID=61421 RepID=A0A2T9YKK4_9FUNG|nr:hypothetical protein BB559_003560 [Furculomyces boomerangus]PVZ99354.1 hypothetical protein BB558_004629 [Smittium angustum]
MNQIIYKNLNSSLENTPDSTKTNPPEIEHYAKLINRIEIETLVPPLNFAMVAPGIYRSGFPSIKNHKFLLSLGLKKIIYIYDRDCKEYHQEFTKKNNITLLHYRIGANKEPFKEMNQEDVSKILVEMLDTRNHPMLVHCNIGVVSTIWPSNYYYLDDCAIS